jgi:hypothetical protein
VENGIFPSAMIKPSKKMAAQFNYDRHEFESYPGNVGY